jgi:4-aminobutyrate aminotransferase-like enzyme
MDLHEELSQSYPDIEAQTLADILDIVSWHINYGHDGPAVVEYLQKQAIELQTKALDKEKDADYIAWLNAYKDD